MDIVGYYVHGKNGYVAFREERGDSDIFKITDGFHDRTVNGIDAEKYCKGKKRGY